MTTSLIDGKHIAGQVRSEVAATVKNIKEKYGIIPGLTAILVGNDPASTIYVRNKKRAATQVGMIGKDVSLPSDIRQNQLVDEIHRVNDDPKVHGIIVQLPLPKHISDTEVVESINPEKDVDGLHPANMGALLKGKSRFVPATPAGIQQLLLRTGQDPDGKHVVVCGRSDIVGKPVSILLMQRSLGSNATVTVCHSRTRNLPDITRQADILIAAIGQPNFITSDMVREGVVVIDVGVNRVKSDSSKKGYLLVGDVDFNSVAEKSAAITPVPGGVGPMTIAMLLNNTLKAAQLTVSGK